MSKQSEAGKRVGEATVRKEGVADEEVGGRKGKILVSQ